MPYEDGQWVNPEEFAEQNPDLFRAIGFTSDEEKDREERLRRVARKMLDRSGDLKQDEDGSHLLAKWASENKINIYRLGRDDWPIKKVFPRSFDEFFHNLILEIPAHFYGLGEDDLPFPPELFEGMRESEVGYIVDALEWKENTSRSIYPDYTFHYLLRLYYFANTTLLDVYKKDRTHFEELRSEINKRGREGISKSLLFFLPAYACGYDQPGVLEWEWKQGQVKPSAKEFMAGQVDVVRKNVNHYHKIGQQEMEAARDWAKQVQWVLDEFSSAISTPMSNSPDKGLKYAVGNHLTEDWEFSADRHIEPLKGLIQKVMEGTEENAQAAYERYKHEWSHVGGTPPRRVRRVFKAIRILLGKASGSYGTRADTILFLDQWGLSLNPNTVKSW